MDGVLYDSMKYHTLAWKQMMEENGITCTRDEFYLYEGMTGAATIDLIWRREFGHPCPEEKRKALYDYKTRIFKELGGNEPMPGADRMLAALCGRGIRCVLVTGSGQASLIDSVRKDYPGVFGEGMMVTARDVVKGKPDPEPYLMGLKKAGVSADEAIVIENAPLGARAGVAAGIRTMAVCTGPIPADKFREEKVWGVFPSMDEFADMLPLALDLIEAESPYMVADTNTSAVADRLAQCMPALADMPRTVIPAGDENKNISTLTEVWRALSNGGATRRSTLFCVGGGMTTDLGGFAAATFKRGVACVNVPTSLLGMVDAAAGGKTGINLDNLKNEVGAFSMPKDVVIIPSTLDSLPAAELLSGYGEMLKTALIADPEMYRALLDADRYFQDPALLRPWIMRCIEIKTAITTRDPKEKGERKALNFGHTAGHALESLALIRRRPVPHGVAVAHGLLWEMILSATACSGSRTKMLESAALYPYAEMLRCNYPRIGVTCSDFPELLALMRHDKKNATADSINFTLLDAVGSPCINQCPTEDEIRNAFDIYVDMAQ